MKSLIINAESIKKNNKTKLIQDTKYKYTKTNTIPKSCKKVKTKGYPRHK